MLFFSYMLTGVISNIVIWLFSDGDYNLPRGALPDAPALFSRPGLALFALVGIMFLVAVVVTYCLANSITKPIEKLENFALGIGHGDFTPNDFQFNELELENLNMALNKSVKQLGEYDNQQKIFFQNASHELRTPLMSIRCYAEGIAFGIMEPQKACETILEETDKLTDLVTDLLYISKIDNITTTYTTTNVNLVELIRDSATRQEAVATKKQLHFSFDFSETSIYYECVSELISRAMDNLISNATRYASSEIILSCKKYSERIEIIIADDGAGIESDAMPHVFERFYKGKGGNHGIGLCIVKSIIEQRGGHITARNSDSGGAVFTITLPL